MSRFDFFLKKVISQVKCKGSAQKHAEKKRPPPHTKVYLFIRHNMKEGLRGLGEGGEMGGDYITGTNSCMISAWAVIHFSVSDAPLPKEGLLI